MAMPQNAEPKKLSPKEMMRSLERGKQKLGEIGTKIPQYKRNVRKTAERPSTGESAAPSEELTAKFEGLYDSAIHAENAAGEFVRHWPNQEELREGKFPDQHVFKEILENGEQALRDLAFLSAQTDPEGVASLRQMLARRANTETLNEIG